MKRIAFAVLTLFVAALPSIAATPSRPAVADEITIESVLTLMNAERRAAGLSPLAADPLLNEAAGDRMRHMEEQGYWAHESPDGLTPFTWMRVRHYEFERAGENLATGFETARLLVTSWMESPGHRANILSPDYEDCGIAVIDGSTKGPASGRSVVVLFGRKARPWLSAAGE